MGNYLNPTSKKFKEGLRSEIYVDKSELMVQTNALIDTRQKFICISRPRRFGKSMALEMVSAYYGCEEDTGSLFQNLKIAKSPSYQEHLNQYNCLLLNMQEFLNEAMMEEGDNRLCVMNKMLADIKDRLLYEFKEAYPDANYRNGEHLTEIMNAVYKKTKRPFVILIDEWDCVFRILKNREEDQKKYSNFLGMWLKDQAYVGLAYMTGILPIKKYNIHSALNMFIEYSMTDPKNFAPFFGFTEDEVLALCEIYHASPEETKAWYDGYHLEYRSRAGFDAPMIHLSMYSPKSLVEAMTSGKFGPYWNKTESYEALKIYIRMNQDGLKDAVIAMLAGERVKVNTGTFTNDMTTFVNKDDVLTLLVHLGYLNYHDAEETVSIPNKEVSQEYLNSIKTIAWNEVTRSIEHSKKLLEAVWNLDSKTVAEGIDRAHQEVSILQYNSENALSYTIGLAFYYAREYYTIIRELPSGKGFADVAMIPRKAHADKPALIIELKWDKDVQGAIAQIKEKNYEDALKEYKGKLLLVGISYDKKEKIHSCRIEKLESYKH
ncbi:ATPase AAA [Clostridia bacterium]|nr:ATPase AAA [Clostridia bacterium]